MTTSAKWIIGIIVLVLIVWGIRAANETTPEDEGAVIKIGVIAPMTGPGAVFGQSLVKGIALAQEDLQDTKNTYEIIVEDDATNAAQSASAAQKLINVDKVSALLTITSGTGHAAAPPATLARIPHVCICADLTVADNEYNFTNMLMPSDAAAAYVVEAQKRGIETIALWSQIHPGINAFMDSLEPQLAAAGITVVYKDRYEAATRDFKTTVTKGKQTNPDTYFVFSFPPSLEIVGKELKDLGITNISGISAFGISADPAVFEGYWFTDPNLNVDFRDRFEKAYPDIRFNVIAAPYGYDSFNMFVDGFEEGGDVAAYIKGLTQYEGIVGRSTKDTSGSFKSPAAVWVIKNAKAELLY